MRKPSTYQRTPPRLIRHLRELQQALHATPQETVFFWQLCAPSRSRLH